MFGFIRDKYGWTRDYQISLFGQVATVEAVIECYEGDEVEGAQKEAYSRFQQKMVSLLIEAESAILSYYDEVRDEIRGRVGPDAADQEAPLVATPVELAGLVRPTHLLFNDSFGRNERIVGLLCNCSWDTDNGLAVKFVDERVVEVGPQDIVL